MSLVRILNKFLSEDLETWFKGSKVVNSEGNPMVVYHGTPKDFSTFDKETVSKNESSGLGFWFTNCPEVAHEFAKEHKDAFFGYVKPDEFVGENIKPVYLKIKNPKVFVGTKADPKAVEERATLAERIRTLKKELSKLGDSYRYYDITYTEYHRRSQEINEELKNSDKRFKELYIYSIDRDPFEVMMDERDIFVDYGQATTKPARKGFWRERYASYNMGEANTEFVANLKKEGYDGIIIQGTRYDSETDNLINQYVVFEPNQIKSAYAKEFKSDSDDITEELTNSSILFDPQYLKSEI